jgi:Leucine-rich repeat (LRR) protein
MLATIRERLKGWQGLPGWREDRVKISDKGGAYNGLITVDLLGLPISDLSPLRGLYIEFLDVSRTNVSDLRPLAGMRLRALVANMLPRLHDLVGLEGMPLKILYVGNNGVSDLSPLRGSPLNWLIIDRTLVTDLSPIQDCPLTRFDGVRTAIQSIEVLRGKMLNQVALDGCEALTDISLLKDCPTLELLTLPPHVRNIEVLRNKPGLVKLSYGDYTKAEPVAVFWAAYDTQHPAVSK